MNKLNIGPLLSFLEKAREIQEKREDYFSTKSEKWQEGEKGEEFNYRTEELSGFLDDLECAVNDLESWNNE